MGNLHEKDFKFEDYDEFYSHHYFKPLKDDEGVNAHRIFPRVAWALDIAKEIKATSVLDLGCLEGYAVMTLAKQVPSVTHGVGVDLSADGIRLAKQRANQYELPTIFVQDSIENYLENCDKKFDLILMFETIEHVKDPSVVLKLIDKVKTENGTVLISTPSFEAPTYGMDDEQNKCHIRLYTTKDEDYEAVNKYGNTRKATSMPKQVGKERILSMDIWSELIHVRYQ